MGRDSQTCSLNSSWMMVHWLLSYGFFRYHASSSLAVFTSVRLQTKEGSTDTFSVYF
ncbi:hypothetical protein XENOCAPTIV_011099, partial [Xenoophorus captivus]